MYRLQLCDIYLELAPKYLFTIFKQYVVLCEDFKGVGKKVDGKLVWDEKQKDWLVARMRKQSKTKKKKKGSRVAERNVSASTNKTVTDSPVAERDDTTFTNQEVTSSPVAEWDVSALFVALLAVSTPEDIVKKVKEVKDLRNSIFHGKKASRDDLKPHVETVQNLKPHLDAVWSLQPHVMAVRNLIQSVESSFPDLPCWKEYLEELKSAADSELHTCYDMICRPHV